MRSLPRLSVDNPVLVNIVVIGMLISGVYCALTLVREMFPESRPNIVVVTAPYPGATPAEIEKGLAQRVEQAIKDVPDVDKVTTQITDGLCLIMVEMSNRVDDVDQAVTDVKASIDAIPRDELPEDAEEIRVSKAEPRLPVIAVSIFGDVDERTRKLLGEQLRDDLLALPEITDLELDGLRKAEITVEIEPEKLIEYGISLTEVANAIRQANLDLPAGRVKTAAQDISVRTLGESDDAQRIAQTVVRSTPSGQVVRVSDLGRVIDGFVDDDMSGSFNGLPAVNATIYKTGDQDAVRMAEIVKAFVAGKARQPYEWDWLTRVKNFFGVTTDAQRVYRQASNDPYPPQIQIRTHSNLSRFIESRLDLLTRNGIWGLALVFLSLLLFLNARVAFWVMMGLVFSVAGTFVLMRIVGTTLNLISMFSLIIVLGLIVDDAIVVGENVFQRIEKGEDPRTAAVKGAQEVTWPVVIAVLTTIGAFVPLLFVEGRIGDFMGILPVVVTCALTVSLIEAFSILPTHLAEAPAMGKVRRQLAGGRAAELIGRLRRWQRDLLHDRFIRYYGRFVRLAVRWRYVTLAAVTGLLLGVLGLVAGHRVQFVFVQKMDTETILIDLEMPVGTPMEHTRTVLRKIEKLCLQTPEIVNTWAIVGARIDADESGTYTTMRSHLGEIIVELQTVEQRSRSSDEVIADLRRQTADLAGINALKFRSMQGGPAGPELELEITGKRMDDILAAADVLRGKLSHYRGVYDLDDDYEEGTRELQVELLDSARPLGLTTRALATEVRGAFYGLEPRTLQRGREDVKIRVRFPEGRRRHVYELENMRIVTPAGAAVPICEVARVTEARSTAAIRRVDQRRAVTVTADVDQTLNNADEIIADLQPLVDQLEREYPGLKINFGGNRHQAVLSLGSLKRDFLIAILVIYFMLAGLFRSYIQPLIVLTAVPFGLNGAILGHLMMGYPLTVLSMIGLVALTGIVVNDALILVDFINKAIAAGMPVREAVATAAERRLRPILLTSLTTVLGLAPLMTETSFQARFLIPMAISISFGLAFATLLTLVVVPANFMVFYDLKNLLHRLWTGRWADAQTPSRQLAAQNPD